MSADRTRSFSQLEAALSRRDNKEGARARQRLVDSAAQIKMVILLLFQAPGRQRALDREMATFISPRSGFIWHTRTLAAAAVMAYLVERSQPFQGWVEGGILS